MRSCIPASISSPIRCAAARSSTSFLSRRVKHLARIGQPGSIPRRCTTCSAAPPRRWPHSPRMRMTGRPGRSTRSIPPGLGFDNGSFALIGDAAHAMTPFAAQGAAMAIEDAWTLAAAVSNAFNGLAPALAAWEQARRRRIQRVARRGAFNRLSGTPPARSPGHATGCSPQVARKPRAPTWTGSMAVMSIRHKQANRNQLYRSSDHRSVTGTGSTCRW